MEKNQHNSSPASTEGENNSRLTGNQPGQQLPAGASAAVPNQNDSPEEKEQHSESSFPQQEGETLGTP